MSERGISLSESFPYSSSSVALSRNLLLIRTTHIISSDTLQWNLQPHESRLNDPIDCSNKIGKENTDGIVEHWVRLMKQILAMTSHNSTAKSTNTAVLVLICASTLWSISSFVSINWRHRDFSSYWTVHSRTSEKDWELGVKQEILKTCGKDNAGRTGH